jgi:murein DD-endopeptidase MepM/ murein hydrolase activator NlpD
MQLLRQFPAPRHLGSDRAAGDTLHNLGNEPPINPAGSGKTDPQAIRQPVSFRWIAGAVLTGMFGASLIGAVLYFSVERANYVAEAPSFAAPERRIADADTAGLLRKADKLVRATAAVGARQTYRAPMTLRIGSREVIKDRNLVRVATSVSTIPGRFAAQVPAYNALRVMSENTNAEQFAEPTVETGEADVSLTKADLAAIVGGVGAGPTLRADDVAAQIEEQRRAIRESNRAVTIPLSAQFLLARRVRAPVEAAEALAYAPAADASPAIRLDVRVIPENVSQIQKYEPDAQAQQPVEKVYLSKRGDVLDRILKGLGAGPADAAAAVGALGGARGAVALEEGRAVRVLLGASSGSLAGRVLRVIVSHEGKTEAAVAREDDGGKFVVVANDEGTTGKPRVAILARRPAATADDDEDEPDDGAGLRLYNSFYETALGQNIPKAVIDELIKLFSSEVDFQRRATSEDQFEVFYGVEDDGEIDLMYAAITVRGQKFRYYRFVHNNGAADYYDNEGRSSRKFLLRKPLASGEMRSGFGQRFHPILRYYRMHNGVDFADKHGTPIVAAGTGRVISANWDRGYGRRVEIEHPNGYVTTYSHLAGFARGIAPGASVRQGQVIGFMGSTGLATGTHLHYEVMVNGVYTDPMRLRAPRTKPMSSEDLVAFKRHVEQVESLLARAPGNARLATVQ